uniref:Protein IQ-DOMAIN 14 n=1 Tax=Anthurium amnicola TaxID=1678845 RepID=A0A1D1YTF9_9ARAE
MGKKGNWILALKRVFTSTPKDKLVVNGPDGEFVKEKKKWAIGKLRHGGTKPFIHLHKEPSSIEQILGDAEREQHKPHHHHPEPPKRAQQRSSIESENAQMEQTKPLASAPVPSPPKRAQQLKATPTPSSTVTTHPAMFPPRITMNHTQKSAIKIQAAYRGYMARQTYRGLRGLVRLQGVMRGQTVKRQTMNAMRLMQQFVRVQSQIRMRRIQAMESQNPQRQTPHIGDKEQDSNISKWSLSHKSDAEERTQGEWDASLLTKEEADVRQQRKVEAVIKRERALAYSSSHQLLKAPPKSPHSAFAELRSGGVPVWWSWLERRFLQAHQPTERVPTPPAATPSNWGLPDPHMRPGSHSRLSRFGLENPEQYTPRSSHGFAAAAKARGPLSSPRKSRHPPPSRAASVRPAPRDDESLTSCPAFMVPGYMAPTLSAKAKVREQAFHRDGPTAEAKKRFSFGLSQSIGSLRWSKGSSLFPPKDSGAQKMRGKHRPLHSMGNLSVDLASQPAGVGRMPFK